MAKPSFTGFAGVYTAIVTPFSKDGTLDLDALARLVDEQVAGGVTGIVPCGTTGESPTLSHEEHREVIRFVVERTAGRAHVMAGCGSNATSEAVALTRFAHEVGADSTLQVCPYYNKPSQEGMVRHFRAIADATPLPVCLYNIPGRTGITLAPASVARLAEHPGIRGIKEATGSMDQASETLAQCEIDVLSGDDSLTLPLMALGGKGVVSVAGNLVPRDVADLVARALSSDFAGARALHRKLFPLCRAMFIESNPVPIKRALALLGRMGDTVRLPLAPLTEPSERVVREALCAYGLLPAA